MQRNHTSESADDHGAQRSDCGPPQQVTPCFSFEGIIDSSKFIDSSRNAVDINDSSNTDTNGMPNEDTHNSLNEDTNDISNTDTDVSNKDTNDSPDEATNDTPNKNTIAIWGHTSQLYSRLHDLHSALILYNEFDDICPDNPPLWSYFHIPFLDQVTVVYLVVGVLKLKERNADVGFLAQLARELVDVDVEVKKEPIQSLALGQERGAVRMRIERYLSVFRKDWQHVATAELAEMRKELMQQVMNTEESDVRF